MKALILAAGKGTRMKSALPKVLHKVGGKAMVLHVIEAARDAGAQKPIVVVGHEGDRVQEALREIEIEFAIQAQQLGTGHGVMQARDLLTGYDGPLLVLCGDTPLITTETLQALAAKHQLAGASATILTANLSNPHGYGRIIRNGRGTVEKIVEQKEGAPEELAVTEINSGAYCFDCKHLLQALGRLTPVNVQGEYYLTDVIEFFVQDGLVVEGFMVTDEKEIMGINDRLQLAEAEGLMQVRTLERLMLSGVTIIDPKSSYIDAQVNIGPDTIIYPNTIVEGPSVIGSNCILGPNTRIVDTEIGNGTEINASIVLKSSIGDAVNIGPFAYIRPDSQIGSRAKIGDFVEIKKSIIGEGSKVPHLSYVGDSYVGQGVNIGAGTITCNYDGEKKSQTYIEDKVFVGSNTNFVAPVRIGESAVIAAGSTITKDVPKGALAVARTKQVHLLSWSDRNKKK